MTLVSTQGTGGRSNRQTHLRVGNDYIYIGVMWHFEFVDPPLSLSTLMPQRFFIYVILSCRTFRCDFLSFCQIGKRDRVFNAA